MRRSQRALAILAVTLVSCSSQVVPASTPTSSAAALRLYATTAVMPLLDDLIARYGRVLPTVTFEVQSGNYQVTLEHLLAGDARYILTNHLGQDSALWAAPLGQDGIALIVHPANPVADLKSEQIRRLFQGRVTNWREVGGADLDIVVFSREDGSGTRAEFERLVMGERRTTQAALVAPSSAAMVSSVARTPGGVGYVSMSYLDESVRALTVDGVALTVDTVYDNQYPLRSTLYVVGLSEPQDAYRAFIAWAQSPEGQAVVEGRYAPLLRRGG